MSLAPSVVEAMVVVLVDLEKGVTAEEQDEAGKYRPFQRYLYAET